MLFRYVIVFYGFLVVMIELLMVFVFCLFSFDDFFCDVFLVFVEYVGLVLKVLCLVFERKYYNEV